MKRICLSLITVILLANLAFAQLPKHSLGLHFGAGDGLGTEISYQYGLSSLNRLEFDLGFNSNHEYANNYRYNYSSWGLTGLYHWVWDMDQGFKWYAGPGARIGAWNFDRGYVSKFDSGIFLAAAGDVGIEYCFPVSIQLALNARPEIGLINHGTNINIGFAIRYQFK